MIELTGHHFHNSDEDRGNRALVFLQRTFIEALKKHTVQLPVFDERGVPVPKTFTMQELGIGFPVVTMQSDLTPVTLGEDTGIPGLTKDGAPAQGTKQVTVKRFDFTIQFCWKQTLPGQRNAPPPAVQQPRWPLPARRTRRRRNEQSTGHHRECKAIPVLDSLRTDLGCKHRLLVAGDKQPGDHVHGKQVEDRE